MTSLLLLKIIYVLANFVSDTLILKYFSPYVYFEGKLDFVNKFNNMTSPWHLITSLCQSSYAQEVGNDEYIIVCNFGGRRMSGFEVIGGGAPRRPPVAESKK